MQTKIIISFFLMIFHFMCVGIDKDFKKLTLAIALQKAQSVLDNYPVEKPEPFLL